MLFADTENAAINRDNGHQIAFLTNHLKLVLPPKKHCI